MAAKGQGHQLVSSPFQPTSLPLLTPEKPAWVASLLMLSLEWVKPFLPPGALLTLQPLIHVQSTGPLRGLDLSTSSALTNIRCKPCRSYVVDVDRSSGFHFFHLQWTVVKRRQT